MFAPTLPTTDESKVRLGAFAPTLPIVDVTKIRIGAFSEEPTSSNCTAMRALGDRRTVVQPPPGTIDSIPPATSSRVVWAIERAMQPV